MPKQSCWRPRPNLPTNPRLPDAAKDRLDAVCALADWIDRQVLEPLIGTRVSGLDRAKISAPPGHSDSPLRALPDLLLDQLGTARIMPGSRTT
jgi:hypothetical protein